MLYLKSVLIWQIHNKVWMDIVYFDSLNEKLIPVQTNKKDSMIKILINMEQ